MNLRNKIRQPFSYSFSNATLVLIAANVFSFLVFSLTNLNDRLFGLSVAGFLYGRLLWQPLSYLFVHSGFQHLFFNMLGLLFFGLAVEKAIGTKEFVLMYFVTGVCSGLFSVFASFFYGKYLISVGVYPTIYMIPIVGASGAIYGILFAYAAFFPRNKIFVWGLIPVSAPVLVIAYAVIEFFSQFSVSNVAHTTHLAGFGFAFLYIVVRMGINPVKIWFGR